MTSNEHKGAGLPEVLDGHWNTAAGREKAVEYAAMDKSRLTKSDVSDFALANAVYMADRGDLDLIVWQTAAKERIRWLSVQLATKDAELSALREAIQRARGILLYPNNHMLTEDGDLNACGWLAAADALLAVESGVIKPPRAALTHQEKDAQDV